jgi:hypothetical protein
MATNTNTKPVSLKEEQEAAKLEQPRESKPITPTNFKKVQRVHALKAIIAPYLAEIEEIKADIYAEMDRKGVDVLTRKGVECVSRDDFESTKTDSKALELDFPEIAALYVSHKTGKRVNWKNPLA